MVRDGQHVLALRRITDPVPVGVVLRLFHLVLGLRQRASLVRRGVRIEALELIVL